MRKRLLAALTILLAGQSAAEAAPPLDTNSPPDIVNSDPVNREPYDDVDAQAETFRFWGSGEYLLWWLKTGRVPPLVTAGGNGKLGSAGTQILVDNRNFDDNVRQGGRFALGYHFATNPSIGVEANFLFLPDRHSDVRFSSDGDPVLAQPFVDATKGVPDATLIASPGNAAGSVTIGARTGLWGAEADLTAGLIRSDTFHLAALGGFRFLRVEDKLTSDELFDVTPTPPATRATTVAIQDEFRTVNNFYGGQVGLETGVQLGLLTIDFRGKLALGQMDQVADVRGATTVLRPNGSTMIFEGGLFALRSNIGRHQRDELAFIPEVDLNVGLQLTRHWKVYAGYSLLWISTVARAGEQIDPLINPTQFPLRGIQPLKGVARPAFNFDGSDFWAQGLNFGLELRY